MRKHHLFKSIFLLLFSFLGIVAINGQTVFEEGFESGSIPSTWSQEQVSGATDWKVEKGGVYPTGAAEGSYRVTLRNTTDQTQGFVTRLITPPMDITSIFQPILVFSLAQEHNLGDVDELKVYFRSSPTDTWRTEPLKVYKDRIRNWQSDTIVLPNPTRTYQIAFEGTDKFGRGIVIDGIKVRSMPVCDKPEILGPVDATSDAFTLYWDGDNLADSYKVKVSKTELTNIDAATNLVVDTVVNVAESGTSCRFIGLEVNTDYHCYVQANCGGENSAWSAGYTYTTKATITEIPYTQNFDRAYSENLSTKENTWTWVNSLDNTKFPYINSQTPVSNRGNYSKNATTCLVFAASNDITEAIPGGLWAYAVAPQIIGPELKTLQVSFSATASNYIDNNYASSITVGIMTDPMDIGSFVAIETVTVNAPDFEEFTIPFDSYTGTGAFIAFVSQFNKKNLFYVDNVKIDVISDCHTVRDVRVKNTLATSTEITWKNLATASSYGVLVTNKEVADPSQATAADIVYTKTESTNECKVPAGTLTANTKYYVYIQANCSKGGETWSKEYTFQTPCVSAASFNYTFENTDGGMNCLYAKSYSTLPSVLKTSDAAKGEYVLHMSGATSSKAYVSFPAINSFTDMWMTFYAKASSSDRVGSKIEVGVMSDINDYSSFVSLQTITVEAGYKHYNVKLGDYTNQGKHIAIMLSSQNEGTCDVYIDDVVISEIPECNYPLNVTVKPDTKTAEFTWEASGTGNSYQIKVSKTSIKDDIEAGEAVVDQVVNTNSFKTDAVLLPNINTYYYYVRSVCGSSYSEWTYEGTFETLCLDNNELPYKENFDSYAGGNAIQQIPTCWNTKFVTYSKANYPYIATTGYSGSKSLYLSAAAAAPLHADYVALPGMDVTSVKELQVSFMMKLGATDTLEVGVLTDFEDINTFTEVKTFIASTNTEGKWQEVIMTFKNYEGSGKYITFYSKGNKNSVYIDDIEVDRIKTCNKPQNLRVNDITINSAKLLWDNIGNESQWQLMILKKDVNPLDATAEDIVFNDIITSNPHSTGAILEANKNYFYYLQSICGSETTEWTLNYGTFKTLCAPKTAEAMGVETFEDNATGFDCWVTGLTNGSENLPGIVSNNGSKRLLITNTPNTLDAYAIMPEVDIDEIKKLQMSFNMYSTAVAASNQKRIVVGIITDPNDMGTFIALDTVKIEKLNVYNKKFTVRFDKYIMDYDGNKGKRVMFRSPYGETNTNEIYLDNIELKNIPACPEPTKISGEYVDGKLHLEWNGDKTMTYRVVVSKISLTEEQLNESPSNTNIVADETVTGLEKEITVANLASYYIYIQNICSEEKGPWSNEYNFTVGCPASYPLPYVEDFGGYADGTAPWCWSSHYGLKGDNLNEYPKLTKDDGSRTGTSLHIYTKNTANYYCMAVSPALETTDISQYQLSFDVAQITSINTAQKFIVGLTDNANVLRLDTAFHQIAEICIATEHNDRQPNKWYSYTYNLSSLAGNTAAAYNHLVFAVERNRGNIESSFYLDNVRIELIPTCLQPARVELTELLGTSFDISWKKQGTATKWNVQYGPKGFALGSGQGTIKTATETKLQISGLTPSTAYDVYVQSDCGSGNESEWVGPFSVTTLVESVTTYPYECDFENDTENALWTMLNGSYTNRWHIGTAAKKDGEKGLYISDDNGVTAKYNITADKQIVWAVSGRAFKFTRPGIYRISYDWNCVGDGTNDYMRVGLVSTVNSFDVVPATSSFGSPTAAIVGSDGSRVTMTYNASGTPDRWVGLEGAGVYAMSANNGWKHQYIDILITEDMKESYNMVFFWANNNSVGSRPNPSAVVDNIKIDHLTCPIPLDVQVSDITNVSAKLSWKDLLPIQEKWSVKILNKKVALDEVSSVAAEFVVKHDTVTTLFYQIPDILVGDTEYFAYVSAICPSNNEDSEWIETSFTTYCNPLAPSAYVYTFDNDAKDAVPDCWVTGRILGTSSSYNPRVYENGSNRIYAKGNSYTGSKSFILSSTSTNKCYAVLPPVSGDLSSKQLRFYARSTQSWHRITETPGKGYQMAAASASNRNVKIGFADKQNDMSTFTEWKTIQLSAIASGDYANEANNYLFDEIFVPLAGKEGKYIVLMSDYSFSNSIIIDDVSIQEGKGCATPKLPQIADITSSSANLSWQLGDENGTKWVVRVARDEEMTDVVRDITVDTHAVCTIDNLDQNTLYYVAVKQVCDELTESAWSAVVNFVTNATLPFLEAFNNPVHNPAGWLRRGHAGIPFISSINTSAMSELTTNDKALSWAYINNGNGFPTGHQITAVRNTGNYAKRSWFMSTIIELPSTEDSWLNFDVALTNLDSPDPISGDLGLSGTDDRFIVTISDDAGKSWKIANATIWDNSGNGDYVYNKISSTGDNITIDLAQYKGKSIRVGFFVESEIENAETDIHIDNIYINKKVSVLYTDEICEGLDYGKHGFDILYNELTIGDNNNFDRKRKSTDASVLDSLVSLKLTVLETPIKIITDSICEGSTYTKYDFNANEERTYKRKINGVGDRCDSVAVLNLSLIKAKKNEVIDNICAGKTYNFNGKTYTKTGIYGDTIISKVTGCDSIINVLNLTVNDTIRETLNVSICHNQTYPFYKENQIELNETGTYYDRVKTADGCDSIVTLNLVVRPDLRSEFYVKTCTNEPYSGHGFNNVPAVNGKYERPLTTSPESGGCDSTIVIYLTVVGEEMIYSERTIKKADLPIEFEGKYYPTSTPIGTYRDTTTVKLAGCESTLVATLHVTDGTGLIQQQYDQLLIVPTIIEKGESVQIKFGDTSLQGLEIEVYDAAGRTIYKETSNTESVEIRAFPNTGIYVIKAISPRGDIKYGRVIVK